MPKKYLWLLNTGYSGSEVFRLGLASSLTLWDSFFFFFNFYTYFLDSQTRALPERHRSTLYMHCPLLPPHCIMHTHTRAHTRTHTVEEAGMVLMFGEKRGKHWNANIQTLTIYYKTFSTDWGLKTISSLDPETVLLSHVLTASTPASSCFLES